MQVCIAKKQCAKHWVKASECAAERRQTRPTARPRRNGPIEISAARRFLDH
jgi:hypothetical protein